MQNWGGENIFTLTNGSESLYQLHQDSKDMGC